MPEDIRGLLTTYVDGLTHIAPCEYEHQAASPSSAARVELPVTVSAEGFTLSHRNLCQRQAVLRQKLLHLRCGGGCLVRRATPLGKSLDLADALHYFIHIHSDVPTTRPCAVRACRCCPSQPS